MIELVDISMKFKDKYAVKDLDMYINEGEIVGLLGPNGAGKSTTISIMSSLISPTSGDVRLHGKSILKDPQPLRKISGVVPQEIALYGDLTAKENLQFFGKLYKIPDNQLKGKITEVLEQIGLTDRQDDLVKTFSGGMKRRLNIGVALLHNPEFIIMDEPTVGIDPQSRKYILETVKRFNEELGMTVVYTSHYMEEVEFLCNRIYIIDQGRVIASGTTEEIKQIISSDNMLKIETESMNEQFIELLEKDSIIYNVTTEDNSVTALVSKEVNAFKTILSYAEETDVELKTIEIQAPTLEDVFLHLTGRALRD